MPAGRAVRRSRLRASNPVPDIAVAILPPWLRPSYFLNRRLCLRLRRRRQVYPINLYSAVEQCVPAHGTEGRTSVVSPAQGTEERARALVDALARQTALSEALKLVIGRSASPLDVVLRGLIESAVRLCRADW